MCMQNVKKKCFLMKSMTVSKIVNNVLYIFISTSINLILIEGMLAIIFWGAVFKTRKLASATSITETST